jgi:[ribosomal protein S5]-alanine N-acetyltransferase
MQAEGSGTEGAQTPAPPAPGGGRGVFDVIEMGQRVFLRPPGEDDRDEFLAMVEASRDLHGHWIHPPARARDYTAFLLRSRKRAGASFLLCRRSDGLIVGVFNLIELSTIFRTAFCSYYVHAGFAGQGLMTEGLRLLMRHAFARLRLQALGASIQPGNTASIALVHRAGFRPENAPPRYLRLAGSWRAHPTWSITAERWRQLAEGQP